MDGCHTSGANFDNGTLARAALRLEIRRSSPGALMAEADLSFVAEWGILFYKTISQFSENHGKISLKRNGDAEFCILFFHFQQHGHDKTLSTLRRSEQRWLTLRNP